MDTKTFIKKAVGVHGNKYTYNKTVYINSKSKLIITCEKHGDFEQLPANHLKYQCKECSKEQKKINKIEKSKSEYLGKIINVHGDKYDLSAIDYIGSDKKINVTCYKHGVFEIAAKHFLSGSGCVKCGKIEASKKIILKGKGTFESCAINVHGDKYDYSHSDYEGLKNSILIICPIHGEFTTTPRSHLRGVGCPECSNDYRGRSLTTEVFIKKARDVHADCYDYSKLSFIKSHQTVEIICRKHGSFWQNPHNHLSGSGCKKCADNNLVKTTNQFIHEAKRIHGSATYNYSKTKYYSYKLKVIINCSVHGDFKQTPSRHLSGAGCQKCKIEMNAKKLAHNNSDFIKLSQLIHNYRWDYGKVNYINNNTKVLIGCEVHGFFEQTPGSHKSGQGCPECGARKAANSKRFSRDQFIALSKKVHFNKYTYLLVEYINSKEKVAITCHKHGIFYQSPSSHMRGCGCPRCSFESISKKNSMPIITFIHRVNEINGSAYDYSLVKFDNLRDSISIKCKTHGFFSQIAERHLNGGQCPRCSEIKRRLQTEDFIDRAKEIHGDRYDYSLSNCNGGESLVKIKCKHHGVFEQKAKQHLVGSGCRKCYVDSTRLLESEFINDCIIKHGNKYDYSQVKYRSIRDAIIIGCPEHGDFHQIAHDHKHGSGCPACAEYIRVLDNKDPNTACYLYYLTLKFNELTFFKVGVTTRGVKQRFSSLKKDGVYIQDEYSVLTTLHKAIKAEQQILAEFSEFKLLMIDVLKYTGGGTECFSDNVMADYNSSLEWYLESIENNDTR